MAVETTRCEQYAEVEALCPCLLEDRRGEVGSQEVDSKFELECNLERHGENVAVLEVGGYELYGVSYYLAVLRRNRWQALALVGEREIHGLGGHHASHEIQTVREIPIESGSLLWVEARSSNSFFHPPRSGTDEKVELTLCRLPEDSAEAASCPARVPLRISRARTDLEVDEPVESESSADSEVRADEQETQDPDDSDEPETREHEETWRFEARLAPGGSSLEVVLTEGAMRDGWRRFLGVHRLD